MDQEAITAELRETTGSSDSRRARRAGRIPATVYGHKQDPISVVVKAEDVKHIVSHRIKMVTLNAGGTVEQVLVKDVQFDTFGDEVLHLDLERIAMDELLHLECPVELIGVAKGAANGGVVDHPTSDLEVECLPANIPDMININISDLEIGDSIHVKDIEAPEGVTILTDPEAILVTIHPPAVVEEEEEEAEVAPEGAGGVEPEIIGRKKEDEEGEKTGDA
jgi:large subunit ribosomal protein L25